MILTPENTQSNQGEQQSGGGVSRGINTVNRLMRSGNPLNRAGSNMLVQGGKILAQAMIRGIAMLFTSPWFWAAITTAIVYVCTFLISLLGG